MPDIGLIVGIIVVTLVLLVALVALGIHCRRMITKKSTPSGRDTHAHNNNPPTAGENAEPYDTLNYQEMNSMDYDDTAVTQPETKQQGHHNMAMYDNNNTGVPLGVRHDGSMPQDKQYETLCGHYVNEPIGSGKPYEILKSVDAQIK